MVGTWLAARRVVAVEQEEEEEQEEEASEAGSGCHPDVEGPNPFLGASEAGISPILEAMASKEKPKTPFTTTGRCQTLSIESKSRKQRQDQSK